MGGVDGICSVLSALRHFDTPRFATIRTQWPSWITDVLGSGYSGWDQYTVAEKVVYLAWEQIKRVVMSPTHNVDAAWLPPLFGFLRLGEGFRWRRNQTAGAIALRVLSRGEGIYQLGLTILPILTSTLQPTHPLRSREVALKVFRQFGPGWFSSQMQSVASVDRASLLHAVGDPFQYAPDTMLPDKQHTFDAYDPMGVAAILIEFASSDLWRDYLHRSNFVTCEEVISTAEGRKSAFRCLQHTTEPWLFLGTPSKVISAIERLETLRCPNTVEAVLACVWAPGGVDRSSVDLDGWKLIQQKTLAFYQTHGIGRLKGLSQFITANHASRPHGRNLPRRVEGVRLPVRIAKEMRKWGCMEDWYSDMGLAQVCQRKLLYQLFGCNPTTWEEMLAADSEGADEGVDLPVGQCGVPARFVDWSCDYP